MTPDVQIQACAFVGCENPAHTFLADAHCYACHNCADEFMVFLRRIGSKELRLLPAHNRVPDRMAA
jgi:hypothetical protein